MTPAVPVTVTARGWGWRHGTRKAWAVRGLDLSIGPGERVLLLGPSGAGKSTLLAGLAGLLDAAESGGESEGELLLDGVPARAARVAAVRAGRARTGLLLQDPQSQTVLARCGDDVAFGLENHAVPAGLIWPRVAAALDAVGLRHPPSRPTARLSGGERQRLALAGVLALAPGLLLLDEPTAMLDPDGAEQVRAAVGRALARTGAGCLLVEHRVEPWLPIIDRVVVLEPGGGVRADGPPAAVFGSRAAELVADGVWVPLPSRSDARKPADKAVSNGLSAGLRAHEPADGGRRGLLLAADGVTVGRRDDAEPAVQDVSVDVAAGRATCLTGPNGAGKTTLALALAGLVAPTGGVVRAAPELARGLGPDPFRWRSRELVSRIGTVFQDPQHQFVAATVRQELAVGPSRLPSHERPSPARIAARTEELLHRLRLDRLERANPFTLSGGEQRRLSVATVLATAPSVLVLDEPTFGQDARTWAELLGLLIELLDAGSAAVLATHDRPLVEALAGSGRGSELPLPLPPLKNAIDWASRPWGSPLLPDAELPPRTRPRDADR